MKTLRDLFVDELMDMYDAEQRIVKALPKLAKAATCSQLRQALEHHLHETEGQVSKLERVFAAFGEKPKSRKCKATVGMLAEGDALVGDFKGSPALNAAIISSAQRVEHYEIASYGCLHAWAMALGNQEAAGLIQEILDQEKAADRILGSLAAEKNQEGLSEGEGSDSFGENSRLNQDGTAARTQTLRRDSVIH